MFRSIEKVIASHRRTLAILVIGDAHPYIVWGGRNVEEAADVLCDAPVFRRIIIEGTIPDAPEITSAVAPGPLCPSIGFINGFVKEAYNALDIRIEYIMGNIVARKGARELRKTCRRLRGLYDRGMDK
jgi:hypothetical protein